MPRNTQKIIPCLWFDNQCREAMEFYTSFFQEGKINDIRYYPEDAKNEYLKNMQGKVLVQRPFFSKECAPKPSQGTPKIPQKSTLDP